MLEYVPSVLEFSDYRFKLAASFGDATLKLLTSTFSTSVKIRLSAESSSRSIGSVFGVNLTWTGFVRGLVSD